MKDQLDAMIKNGLQKFDAPNIAKDYVQYAVYSRTGTNLDSISLDLSPLKDIDYFEDFGILVSETAEHVLRETMQTQKEENGILYLLNSDGYYYPQIAGDFQNRESIGRFGNLKLEYMEEQQTQLLQQLIMDGKLLDYLHKVNDECWEKAELEPMVCGHSNELNDIDFIKEPTAIFLMCPDSNTTRHFFASLFIRYLMNDLIEQADSSPKLTLDRPVLDFWDEFGNMPPIKDFDVLTSAARSRGVRFLLSLQDYGQLEKNYSKTLTKIIRGCIQMLITTYVSPSSREMAEEISKVLGNKTVQSGSVTRGHGYSQSLQMISRPLLTASEIIQLKQGEFIVIKAGTPNVRTDLPMYWDYMKDFEDFEEQVKIKQTQIEYLTGDQIQTLTKRKKYKLTKGQFD